jgi:hypothetical protein
VSLNLLNEAERITDRGKYDVKKKKNRMAEALDVFIEAGKARHCVDPSICSAQADIMMVDHYRYDVGLAQVAAMAVSRRITKVFGFFVYCTDMDVKDSGYIDSLDIYYIIDRPADRVYYFNKGDQICPEYTLSSLQVMMRSNSVTIGDRVFTYEVFDRRDCLYFYKLVDIGFFSVGIDDVSHPVWQRNYDQKMVLRTFKLRNEVGMNRSIAAGRYLDPNDPSNYVAVDIIVPRRLVVEGLMYGCDIKNGEITMSMIEKRLDDHNSKVIVNGLSFKAAENLNSDDLRELAYAVFSICYELRTDENKTAAYLKDVEKTIDLMTRQSLVMNFCRSTFRSLKLGLREFAIGGKSRELREEIQQRAELYPMVPSIAPLKRFDIFSDRLVVEQANYRDVVSGFVSTLGCAHVVKNLIDPASMFRRILEMKEQLVDGGVVTESTIVFAQNMDQFYGYMADCVGSDCENPPSIPDDGSMDSLIQSMRSTALGRVDTSSTDTSSTLTFGSCMVSPCGDFGRPILPCLRGFLSSSDCPFPDWFVEFDMSYVGT